MLMITHLLANACKPDVERSDLGVQPTHGFKQLLTPEARILSASAHVVYLFMTNQVLRASPILDFDNAGGLQDASTGRRIYVHFHHLGVDRRVNHNPCAAA
jgi:hypothetical protein